MMLMDSTRALVSKSVPTLIKPEYLVFTKIRLHAAAAAAHASTPIWV